MSEVFEDNQNCFELFGFDFIIDADLKCWLLEANMSPACSDRHSQPWFQKMTETMCDGMLNIIEHKIIKTFASMTKTHAFGGKLQTKINDYLQNGDSALLNPNTLLGWHKINFDDPLQAPEQPLAPVAPSVHAHRPLFDQAAPTTTTTSTTFTLTSPDLGRLLHRTKASSQKRDARDAILLEQ